MRYYKIIHEPTGEAFEVSGTDFLDCKIQADRGAQERGWRFIDCRSERLNPDKQDKARRGPLYDTEHEPFTNEIERLNGDVQFSISIINEQRKQLKRCLRAIEAALQADTYPQCKKEWERMGLLKEQLQEWTGSKK